MLRLLEKKISGKRICILGFGREGQSTYHCLRRISRELDITIADRNPGLKDNLEFLQDDTAVKYISGQDYLSGLGGFDIIFKTPGIPMKDIPEDIYKSISSQTEIFLEAYRKQVVGVTGTKGKSTTASLIHHIVKEAGNMSLLVGNIGLPPFEVIDMISPETMIIFEMSSHQLESTHVSPGTAVILNFYEEHLDYYHAYADYKSAKLNIARWQHENDSLIYNADDAELKAEIRELSIHAEVLPSGLNDNGFNYSYHKDGSICLKNDKGYIQIKVDGELPLKGEHNLLNSIIAANVCYLKGLDATQIRYGLITFKGLKHRLEFVGVYDGVSFYDDSIATIPQACMEAIKTLGNVEFLILGGYDRGIDYSYLATFLARTEVGNIICIGNAGKRIYDLISAKGPNARLHTFDSYKDIFDFISQHAKRGDTCLLSPAAASYDMFKSFEERGDEFARLAKMIRISS